jgi:DNA primase
MEHIADLLRQKNISFNISGPDFLVKCLNPEHEDSNPSMRIDKTTGIYNCFACGFKGNIFKYFGILTNNTSLRVAKLKEKLRMLAIDTDGIPMPDGAVPFSTEFRGISKKTLKQFGAFYTDSVTELQDRIVFPITDISGKTVVYVARHSLSSGNPRYINYPRGVKIPVFPSILESATKSIVLVEGIFDFLNVYDKGLHNAVCTFGTNTLMSDTKAKLQPFKAQGVTKVFIMFDGDEAGREAAYKLKPQLEEMEFVVEVIKLEDGSDPGELSLEYVTSLREYIYA